MERGGPGHGALDKLRKTAEMARDAVYAGDFQAFGHSMIVNTEAQGELFLVAPRIGTISPWSSKATDIAFNCDLEPAIERIEP